MASLDFSPRKTWSGVHPDYRAQGIGSELLLRAFDKCNKVGFEIIELNVYTHNLGAFMLYTRMGFERLCVMKNYRQHNGGYEHSYYMEKDLSK